MVFIGWEGRGVEKECHVFINLKLPAYNILVEAEWNPRELTSGTAKYQSSRKNQIGPAAAPSTGAAGNSETILSTSNTPWSSTHSLIQSDEP
jgi:hypothetical protein